MRLPQAQRVRLSKSTTALGVPDKGRSDSAAGLSLKFGRFCVQQQPSSIGATALLLFFARHGLFRVMEHPINVLGRVNTRLKIDLRIDHASVVDVYFGDVVAGISLMMHRSRSCSGHVTLSVQPNESFLIHLIEKSRIDDGFHETNELLQ